MLCSISGEVPEVPVISRKSGLVFEKRLLEKHLKISGNMCPVTNEELLPEDIIEIKCNKEVKPRAPNMSSIPSMISAFQNEFDGLILELYNLRKSYNKLRQELSQSLYQNDAACRVIARLMKEKEQAVDSLKKLELSVTTNNERNGSYNLQSETSNEEMGINQNIIQDLENMNKELSSNRKKKIVPEGMVIKEEISGFKEIKKITSLGTAKNNGINGIDVNEYLTALAQSDKNISIYNEEQDKIICELKGHTKRVNNVKWEPNTKCLISYSQDKNILIWKPNEGLDSWEKLSVLSSHSDEVTSFDLHPSSKYGVSTSLDGTWKFHDLISFRTIESIVNPDNSSYSCGEIHPDGFIFAAGANNSVIQLWHFKAQNIVASLTGHISEISSISFSENGYTMASCDVDNVVKIWDLRKLTNTHTFESGKERANKVLYDKSGNFLAIGGSKINIYKSKSWESPLISLTENCTNLVFGSLSRKIYAVSKSSRNLSIFGVE